MAPQIIPQLTFSHFVATGDGTIFASARDIKDRVYNFLIYQDGTVKEQVRDHFEPLTKVVAEEVRAAAESCYSRVPTYRVNSANFS
jgi:L-asparaginase II